LPADFLPADFFDAAFFRPGAPAAEVFAVRFDDDAVFFFAIWGFPTGEGRWVAD
jgi:hypothetical protein